MKRTLWAVLGAVLLATGCGDPVAPTTPTPAVPTVTDTFSDTLLVLGANTHQFTVSQIGGVKVTLPSVEPGAGLVSSPRADVPIRAVWMESVKVQMPPITDHSLT